MKTLKKVLRLILLALLIILAASAGLAALPITRERYVDKEIRIEQVDKKKGDDETNEDQE